MSDINDIIILELNRTEKVFHTLSPQNQIQAAKSGAVRPEIQHQLGQIHGTKLLTNLYNIDAAPLTDSPAGALGHFGMMDVPHAVPKTGAAPLSASITHMSGTMTPDEIAASNDVLNKLNKNTIYTPDINDLVQNPGSFANMANLNGNDMVSVMSPVLRHETDEIRNAGTVPHHSMTFLDPDGMPISQHISPKVLQQEMPTVQYGAPWNQSLAKWNNFRASTGEYGPDIQNMPNRKIRQLKNQSRKSMQVGMDNMKNFSTNYPELYQQIQNDPNDFEAQMTARQILAQNVNAPYIQMTNTGQTIQTNPALAQYNVMSPLQRAAQKARQSQELLKNQNYIQNKQNSLLNVLRQRQQSLG